MVLEGSNSILGNGECGVREGGKGCFKGKTKDSFVSMGLTGVEGRMSDSVLAVAKDETRGEISEAEANTSFRGSCASATTFGRINSSERFDDPIIKKQGRIVEG